MCAYSSVPRTLPTYRKAFLSWKQMIVTGKVVKYTQEAKDRSLELQRMAERVAEISMLSRDAVSDLQYSLNQEGKLRDRLRHWTRLREEIGNKMAELRPKDAAMMPVRPVLPSMRCSSSRNCQCHSCCRSAASCRRKQWPLRRVLGTPKRLDSCEACR